MDPFRGLVGFRPRNGGMAEWLNGGMVEWRNGGMAEWRNGIMANGMAEWRNGRRNDVMAVTHGLNLQILTAEQTEWRNGRMAGGMLIEWRDRGMAEW